MADLQKTVSILFQGDDQISKTLVSMSGELETFSTSVSDIADPLADIGLGILAFEGAVATLTAGGIAYAIQKNGEFRSGLSEVNTMIGLGADELSIYSDQVDEYSRISTQSIDQILKSLYNAASLSVGYADSLDAVGAAEKLAVGAKAELNASLETLVGTMNAYGAPMNEITDYSDAFFTIIKNGKTTLPELSSSIANVTGIAAAAGIPFDTLGAALAAMTASGAPTSEAITKVRSAIEALLTPTPAASKAAAALGIDLSEAALKSKGFPAVLQEIYDKTGGSVEKMSTMITSTEGLQAALILGADKSGIFAKSLGDMENKVGATDTAFNQMADNQNLIWQNMTNNFDSMIRAFGKSLDENGNDLIASFAGLWDSIRSGLSAGAFDPLLKLINEFTGGAEEAIKTLAKNLPEALKGVNFEGFADSVRELADQLLKFFNIDLSNQNSIRDSIQAIVDSFETLNRLSASMINAFTPVKEAIVELVEWFNDLDDSTQRFIGTGLGIAVVASPMAVVGGAAGQMVMGFAGLTGIIANISGAGGLTAALSILAAHPAFKILASAGIGWTIGTYIRDLTPAVDDAAQGFFRLLDRVINFTGQKGNVNLTPNLDGIGKSAADTAGSVLKIPENLDKIPDKKESTITIGGTEYSIEQLKLIHAGMVFENKTVDLKITADVAKAESNINVLKFQLEDGTWASIKIDADKKALTNTTDALKNNLDPFKTLEIKSELDIAKIQADAKKFSDIMSVFNTQIEWSAKIDIAEIEADAKKVQAAFESIGSSVVAVSGTVESMFSGLTKATGSVHFNELLEVLKTEMKTQDKLVDAQIKLIEAQIKSMAKGDAMFTISGENVSQGAKAFMMDVLKEIQIEMSGNAASYLMGAKT